MEILSQRILNMAESETLAMTAKARELKAQGKDVISLSIGEPDFNTPEVVKEAAKKAIDDNFTHYPPVPGYQDLKEAICTKLLRDNGLEYKPEQIVVSTGAKQSLFQVVQCLINPGDEVIIPTPFWVSYKEFVRLAEGKCVFVKTKLENDFKVTRPAILRVCSTPRRNSRVSLRWSLVMRIFSSWPMRFMSTSTLLASMSLLLSSLRSRNVS